MSRDGHEEAVDSNVILKEVKHLPLGHVEDPIADAQDDMDLQPGDGINNMRAIFRKLYRHQILNDEEYGSLMHYAEDLRLTSPQSYALFYERFASLLFQDHYTYLPRFCLWQ